RSRRRSRWTRSAAAERGSDGVLEHSFGDDEGRHGQTAESRLGFMEDALLSRARSGDRDAMERVLSSVAPSIRRFAVRMCKNETDADDVLQDALLSIATHL